MDLSSNVEKILGIVTNLPLQEFWLAWGLENDLKSLKTSLSGINAVMQDAEKQRATNQRLSHWLRQLKHVLYDAEDVLDDFAYEVLRKQVVNTHGGIKRKVRRYFSSSNPVVYRLKIGHRVKEIRQRLDEINFNKNEFNLAANLQGDNSRFNWLEGREMTHSYVNTYDIIGRDADKEIIMKFLMHSQGQDEDITVIPIVGMGGLGKTALTKMIFNNQRVDECFELKVWVCLGDMKKLSVNQVMTNIVKSLTGEKSVDGSNPQHLQHVIRGKLQNKRYLLIFDDMWDADRSSWLELKTLLACGVKGCKILVTTRISLVASCVGTVPPYKLKGLPLDECILLFKKLAFSSEDEVERNLMKIGVEIVKKCRGVPLAVRSLGSLLFSKSDEREWLEVRDSIWQIDEIENGIISILKFSYDHLPSHLKQCFVYCSVFPEDYLFFDSTLISFWMALGLLQPPKSRQLGQDIQTFQPEYTVSDQSVGVNITFVEACISNWKHLKVLSLGKSEFEELPKPLGTLKHLRSLDLTDCKRLKRLPNSICKLHNLQTLLLEGCIELEELPRRIGELINLRRLEITTRQKQLPKNGVECLTSLQYLTLVECQNLEILFEGTLHLTSLHTLVVAGCPSLISLFELSTGMDYYLPALETLLVTGCINLNLNSLEDQQEHGGSSTVSQYLQLPSLKMLEIIGLPKLENTWPKWIQECASTLQFLKIFNCENLKALPDWLPNLTSLRTLKIFGCPRLKSLPQGMERLTSLKELRISSCGELIKRCHKEELGGEDWPKIAHIPNIHILQ